MKNKILELDSNIFIYHFETNSSYIQFTNYIFNKLLTNECLGVTSIISLIETLSYPSPPNIIKEIEESFKTLPNFAIYEITQDIGIEASRIRREYGFRLPVAIQLATGLSQKADVFITNDAKLPKFKELEVVLLEDFAKKA